MESLSRRQLAAFAAAGGITAIGFDRPRATLAQAGCFTPLPAVEGRALLADILHAWGAAHELAMHAAALPLIGPDATLPAIDAAFVSLSALANAAAANPLVVADGFLTAPASAAVTGLAAMESGYNTLIAAPASDATDALLALHAAISDVARSLQVLSFHVEDLLPGDAWQGFGLPSNLKARVEVSRAATASFLAGTTDDPVLWLRQEKYSVHARYYWLDLHLAQGLGMEYDEMIVPVAVRWTTLEHWITAHGHASSNRIALAGSGDATGESWLRYAADTLELLAAIDGFEAQLAALAAV